MARDNGQGRNGGLGWAELHEGVEKVALKLQHLRTREFAFALCRLPSLLFVLQGRLGRRVLLPQCYLRRCAILLLLLQGFQITKRSILLCKHLRL